MKKILLFASLFTSIALSSCKKCEIPDGKETGEIVVDIILRENQNSLTPFDNILIQNEQDNQSREAIDVSFDNGYSYQAVDFSQYSLMAIKTTTLCSATFNRNVVMDEDNGVVTYTVDVNECPTCTNKTTIDNWVMVKKVPDGFTPLFILND